VKRADFIRYWRRSGLTEVYCTCKRTSCAWKRDRHLAFCSSPIGGHELSLRSLRTVLLRGVRWRPHVRIWGLSEANLRYWRKYLRHCWNFSMPPVIRRPGNCAPLATPLVLLLNRSVMRFRHCSSLISLRTAKSGKRQRAACFYAF